MPLPGLFVWTRFGAEAGQSIADILRRKEQEREANGGVFYWGIGNGIGPSMIELLRQVDVPEVLFSPIRSSPRQQDIEPEKVVAWTAALGLDGAPHRLPVRSLITSRFNVRRPGHYALVCKSDIPLPDVVASSKGKESLRYSELHNILSGRPLGSSQVTAVVQRQRESAAFAKGPEYDVYLYARLVPPYLIHLSRPRFVSTGNSREWANAVGELWRQSC